MYEIGQLTRLPLGYVGENNTRTISIDMGAWLDEYPDALIAIQVIRPVDRYKYFGTYTKTGDIIHWTVGGAEVMYAGKGLAQISLYNPATKQEYKSRAVSTVVAESIEGFNEILLEDTDPAQKWVNKVLEAAESAADSADLAKAEVATVGQEKPQYLPVRTSSSFEWVFRYTIYDDGSVEEDNFRGATTVMIPIDYRVTVMNLKPATDHMGRVFNVFVSEFKDGVFVKRTKLTNESTYTTAVGSNGIRFTASYPTAVAAEMTITNIKRNFAVGFVGHVAPGDGQRPVYVAFGASTTVGAVHWPDKAHTYTPYAFPDYIGQVLGLETTNLGNGSTGFVARNGGKSPNFMDAIYNNDEKLREADLITLTFGYGNDAALDPKLPFGNWDDYFPYDTVGAFYVDGDKSANMAGITTMLNAGATLMGCLNWCIRYIGTNYPKATLVCIFGAPSGNKEYPISVLGNDDANAGTYGHPRFKIAVDRKIGAALGDEEIGSYDKAVNTLRAKLNIPIINMNTDALPFSYYSTTAVADDGMFAVFSTVKNDDGELIFNSHPNERGYLMYARYLAGRVSEYFKH